MKLLMGYPSSSFRDMRSGKSGPNLTSFWHMGKPISHAYGANGQMTMTVHNYKYRPRQFHRTSNGENRSSDYRYMGSLSLTADWPPAQTMTTIPLQPRGLRGKKQSLQNFAHDTTGFSVVSWNVQKMLRYDNQKWKNCSKMNWNVHCRP